MAKEHTLTQSTAAGGAKPAKPVGNAGALRAGAIVLWIAAIAFEVCAILSLNGTIQIGTIQPLYLLIGFMILDLICVIIGSQLWKKANHIKPASEKNQLTFWLWNNLGSIVSVIAFLPLIILILTNKDADKKTKTIAAIAAAVCLAIGGVTSYDFNPVSAEQQEAAMQALGEQTVYWAEHGKVYHTHEDCQHLDRTDNLTYGSVEQAIAENRVRLCKTCAKRDGITDVATEK